MESRLENCLRTLKLGSESNTEHSKKFINDLACILLDNCTTEIDSAIQRFLLRSRSTSLTSSGIQLHTPRLSNGDSSFVQQRLRSIANLIVFEPGFKATRSRFFKVCHKFRPPLSRSSSSDIRYLSPNSADSNETVLALSAFSFGYSLRSMAEQDLNRHFGQLADSNADIKLRQNSLDILLGISPMMVARNSDLGLFITKLSDVLSEPLLFGGMMQFLNRLLLIKDEQVWIKVVEHLSQSTELLLNLPQLTTKAHFVDFMLQLIGNNSNICRHFSLDAQTTVLRFLIAVLKPDSKFLIYSMLLNPSATWIRSRVSIYFHRSIIAPTLIELINSFVGSNKIDKTPKPQAHYFYFSLLLYCTKYSDVLRRLDQEKVAESVRTLLGVALKKKKFKCALLLIETSFTQTTATFFAAHLFDSLASIKLPLAIKVCTNILRHCSHFDFSTHSSILASLIEQGLNNQNATYFQLTIELLEVLHVRNWLHHIQLNQSKLIERLEPRTSPQHARLMLALGLTQNPRLWTHSFKHFIRSCWLPFIGHPVTFSTVEERHIGNRLINKFMSFGDDRLENAENKWETSYLLWMLITQPFLAAQLVDPFDLTLMLNDQFQKIGQNQQTDFLQRLSMLATNLDTLVALRKHFSLTTKLPQILQNSLDHKIITDERLLVLTQFFRQWFISGPNELEFKKMADLRLFMNGSSHKKQLNLTDLKFPLLNSEEKPLEDLKNVVERGEECDYQTFVEIFANFLQSERPIDGSITFTTLNKEEWLIIVVDYAFTLGLISSKRSTRLKLSNTPLPKPIDDRNDWFLAALLLFAKFDTDLISKLVNGLLTSVNSNLLWPALSTQPTEFFASVQKQLMPLVHKLLNDSYFELVRQRVHQSNVPLFHLLAHFTYRHYIGLVGYGQLVEYFAMQLIIGPKFQAIFFVLVLEHICLFNQYEPSISLRRFFQPDLDNFTWRSRPNTLQRCIELLNDDKNNK